MTIYLKYLSGVKCCNKYYSDIFRRIKMFRCSNEFNTLRMNVSKKRNNEDQQCQIIFPGIKFEIW